jgi:hypothetical protein
VARDVDRDDDVDLVSVDFYGDGGTVLLNRSRIPYLDSRRGNVNSATGPITDVLFVNGSSGAGRARRVVLDARTPFELRLDAPPSKPTGPSAAVIWNWIGAPTPRTVTPLPRNLGSIAMPTPLKPGAGPQPRFIANSIGIPSRLGAENWPIPSAPAPTVLFFRENGVGRAATLYYQGLILDSAGPNGVSAVTNGIEVVVR